MGKIFGMERKGGFRIKKEYRTIPEIKDAMFDLFVYYSTNNKSKKILCGDGSTYECLLGMIGDFKDLRTLPYLLKDVSRSLAKLGRPAIAPVLEKLKNGNRHQKSSAAGVLRRMVKEKEEGFTAQGEDREKIKQALLNALEDKDNGRIHVVHSLSVFKDKELLPVFEKLAKEDTIVWERKDHLGKIIKKYTVREAATLAMTKLMMDGDLNHARILPYLLENIGYVPTGRLLANLGKPAIDPVLERLKNGNSYEKEGATLVLKNMVKEKKEGFTARGEDREKIKQS